MDIKCVICGSSFCENDKTVVVRDGKETLERAATARGLPQKAHLIGEATEVKVHLRCRKWFTDMRQVIKLEAAQAASSRRKPETDERALRSREPELNFNFNTCCLFCGKAMATEEEKRKHPDRHEDSTVMTLDILGSTREMARNRDDDWGRAVLLRSENITDLVATNTRYHRQCFRNFNHPRELSVPSRQRKQSEPADIRHAGRPSDTTKSAAFDSLCKFLEESEECQFSLRELVEEMQSLAPTADIFSPKHLVRKLEERYGPNIVISAVGAGCDSTVCFRGAAAKLLHRNWYNERTKNPQEERKRIVKAAGEIIREDIRMQVHDVGTYPPAQDILNEADSVVPDTLQTFLEEVVKVGKIGNPETVDRKILFLCHNIMSATRPRSFVSALQLSVGVVLHRKFGSRYLVDLLHSLGVCCSYHEVVNYESSLVKNDPMVVKPTASNQYAYDNADCNIKTLDGHGTFHIMAGIRMITPATAIESGRTRIPRTTTTCADISKHGLIPLKPFQLRNIRGLSTVRVADLGTIFGESSALYAARLDALWLSAPYLGVSQHCGWNGFMTAVTSHRTDYQVSFVEPLPFVNSQPSNPSTVYTSLMYSVEDTPDEEEAVVVTMDQQLYVIACDIVLGAEEDSPLRRVVLRLGGFHMLMSYMGAIGNIMSGSGLEELWNTIYAKNTVGHMINGHAYSRALRAHLLTQLALTVVLLESQDSSRVDTHLNNIMKDMYEKLWKKEITVEEILESRLLAEMNDNINALLDEAEAASRTGRIWVQYWRDVQIIRLFVRAERSGNWELHLFCVQSMLPRFHAAAHLNYAKSGHYYLQSMKELSTRMKPNQFRKFTEGFFTVRRSDRFWSGIWTDLTIEQTVMKYLSLKGGLFQGRRLSDATIAKWIKSLPAVTQIQERLEEFTKVSSATSEQHVELRDSRQLKDQLHAEKLKLWLTQFSPFNKQPDLLVSLSSGVIGDETVNCDRALECGLKCIEKTIGKNFAELQLHRKDKVVNLAAMGRAVKVRNETVTIQPNQLFHRIICVVKSDEELASCFAYELSPNPPALFEDRMMRKGTKSTLIKVLKDCTKTFRPEAVKLPDQPCYVLDGGYLLHKVIWPRPATFMEIFEAYGNYVDRYYGKEETPETPVVVFDGYDTPSTKDDERLRRAAKSGSVDIEISDDITTSMPADKFFSNSRNKSNFITLLGNYLRKRNIHVTQAEGDADRTIVMTAVERRRHGKQAVVVGEDTDLVVLMASLAEDDEILMLIPGRGRNPRTLFSSSILKQGLGDDHEHLLFLHAISGCDTTSALFRKGKSHAFRCLKNSSAALKEKIRTFRHPNASHEEISTAGELFVARLYGAQEGTSLNHLRFSAYQRAIAKQPLSANFDLAVLPPTCESAKLHSYRTYCQVQEWLGIKLEATQWGWRKRGHLLQPVPTLSSPAPDELLSLISCNCKKGCERNCLCRKSGLNCSGMCGHCGGNSCSNSPVIEEDSDPDEL